jgi:hypothetical protein
MKKILQKFTAGVFIAYTTLFFVSSLFLDYFIYKPTYPFVKIIWISLSKAVLSGLFFAFVIKKKTSPHEKF